MARSNLCKVLPESSDNPKQCCVLCGMKSSALYGKFFSTLDVHMSVHQYCLFFASGLAQNGGDNEGFDGFLPQDISQEASRGKRLKCSFCRKIGATVGCAVQNCKIRYHYPCGKKNGTLEQFFGPFDAFCKRHKPHQNSPREEWFQATCAICLESLVDEGRCRDFLKMPCCTGNYMHKDCLQKHASSSGYFCTCPICKNCDEFQLEMKTYGIYIPERDALWEEDNAFADLLEVYNHCDCRYCYCPSGRNFSNKSGRWKMYRCQICGHSASHLKCAEAEGKRFFPFKCDNCINIELQSQFREKIERQTRSCAVSLTDIATYIAVRMISFAESREESIHSLHPKEGAHLSRTLETNVSGSEDNSDFKIHVNERNRRTTNEGNNIYSNFSFQDGHFGKSKLQLKSALYIYIESMLRI